MKKTICIADTQLYTVNGGGQVFVSSLVDNLSKSYNIIYIGDREKILNCKECTTIKPLKNFFYKLEINKRHILAKGIEKLCFRIPTLSKIIIKKIDLNCDIIISNSITDYLTLKRNGNLRYKAAIIIKHHPYYKFNEKYPDFIINEKKYIIFALNYEDLNLLKKRYDNNVNILKLGVISDKKDKISPPKGADFYKDKSIIFSIGRLSEKQKRFSLGIEAFSIIANRYKNLIYAIAGTGPDMKRYAKLAKKLGIQEKVRFLGFISDEEKNWFLKNSKIVLQTSEKENQSIVLIEALNKGAVTLSTSNASSEFLIKDNLNGFLTPYKKEDIAQSLEKILKLDKSVLNKVSNNAIKSVKDFTAANLRSGIIRAINKLLD